MFWICLFALIMEIVFRAQNNVRLPLSSKNASLRRKPELMSAPVTPLIPKLPIEFSKDEPVPENLLKERNLLVTKGVIYLVRNANDGSLLTASATRSSTCLYRLSGITTTQPLSPDDRNWLTYNDHSHQQLTTQLWEISNASRELLLQPAVISSVNKWTWRENLTPQAVIKREDPLPAVPVETSVDAAASSYDFPAPDLEITSTTTTTTTSTSTAAQIFMKYDYENYRPREELKHLQMHKHHRKHHLEKKSVDGRTNSRNKRSLDYPAETFSGERSVEQCELSGSRILWKSEWELVSTGTGMSLNTERFQIRNIRGKCVQSGGFIGICPERRLGSDSNCSWKLEPVADLIAMH